MKPNPNDTSFESPYIGRLESAKKLGVASSWGGSRPLNPIPYVGGSWMFFWRTKHYYVFPDRYMWLQTKWQFTFKYIQGQKSFGFTFYHWKLSNFWISKILIHWFFQNFQEFVRKINELKKRLTFGEIWTHARLNRSPPPNPLHYQLIHIESLVKTYSYR